MTRSIQLALMSSLLACSSRMAVAPADHHDPHDPPRPMLGAPIERAGRPLTGNALLGLFAPADVANRRKEDYNRAAPGAWSQFIPDLQRGLALYDGFDGSCGNQWLAAATADPDRYRRLAATLADDRLWIDSRSTTCRRYLAVEQAALADGPSGDCGGRIPTSDAVDVFRSLLILGAPTGLSDGVDRDDHEPSNTDFPFLAAP